MKIELRSLKKSKWWEYVLRFVFGGAVTVVAGLIAKQLGPSYGGLYLAFPSILPASLTLLASHKGRDVAREDARGAAVGALGLALFGVVVWLTAERWAPPLTLAAAMFAWTAASVLLWAALVARRGEESGH